MSAMTRQRTDVDPWQVAAAVTDPELPMVTLADLGVLRDVRVERDGTQESHRRAQAGVDAVWPLLAEVFRPTDLEQRLTAAGIAVDPSSVRDEVRDVLIQVLEKATLTVPAWPADATPRGRLGTHGPELAELLGPLQTLAREHPAATW